MNKPVIFSHCVHLKNKDKVDVMFLSGCFADYMIQIGHRFHAL